MKASKSVLLFELLLLATFANAGHLSHAAIRYTPANVPFALPGPQQIEPIDFNGDSIPEFRLRSLRADICACLPGDPLPPYWVMDVLPGTGATNQMHIVDAPGHQLFPPQPLPAGFVVDGAKPYGATDGDGLFDVVINTGQWRGNFQPSTAQQFVGVKFFLAGNTRYGWIKIKVPAANEFDSVRLLGYAYDDGGSSILAGQVPEPANAMLVRIALAAVFVRRTAWRTIRTA